MAGSKIEWTDRSDWNPVRGCTRVSPGCGGPGEQGGCYAEGMAARFSKPSMWGHGFAEMQDGKPRWTGKVELQEDRLRMPLSWRKPAKVFPNSTSDFFHEALPDGDIDKLFAVMALCPHLTFQIPTKRAERMRQWFASVDRADHVGLAMLTLVDRIPYGHRRVPWPLPNVWLGVSAERQQEADERIPQLLKTPAAVRFVSAEPLLGPIDFMMLKSGDLVIDALQGCAGTSIGDGEYDGAQPCAKLDWMIVGGESGPGARPMHPQWARSIRDQCAVAGVPLFFKQWGAWAPNEFARAITTMVRSRAIDINGETPGWPDDPDTAFAAVTRYPEKYQFMSCVGKGRAGRLLDGKEHNEFPKVAA